MYAKGEYVRPFGELVRIAPVTMPAINLPPLDDEAIEAEAAEAAARIRTIRLGRGARAALNKAESFEGWKAIGAALAVGKAHALKVTGANRAWGRNYGREFGEWIKQHGFDKMPAATRSVAVELHEHAEAITSWRNGLPERQRKRLIHPLSVTRRWRASTAHGNGKCPHRTYGATPGKRGLVSVPARGHCRRIRLRPSGKRRRGKHRRQLCR
jgi:hypothetical protein